jgi:hypothetical protein
MELVGDLLVEASLLLERSAGGEGELDENALSPSSVRWRAGSPGLQS